MRAALALRAGGAAIKNSYLTKGNEGNKDLWFLKIERRGFVFFWMEMETAFDEPFRSYATQEFRRRPLFRAGKL
jgi:hypothetical protein